VSFSRTPLQMAGDFFKEYALYFVFVILLAVIITNIPTWTVAALGDNADVGRFAAAAYILTLGSLLGSSLNSMFIGEYQSIASDQGFQPLLHRLKQTTIRIGLVGILLSTLAFLIGPFLLESVYGHSFTFSPWLIAALTAEGTSRVEGVNLIDRGYEHFMSKLESLNAAVTRLA